MNDPPVQQALAGNEPLRNLGNYTGGTPPGHLRLHDLGELLRREALRRGFVPLTEFKIGVLTWGQHTGKIDWVWRRGPDGPIVAAFEIEGRDASFKTAGHPSLIADHHKLMRLAGARKWLLLFQVDHDLQPKDGRPNFDSCGAAARQLDAVGPHDIRVAMDADLWDPAFRARLAESQTPPTGAPPMKLTYDADADALYIRLHDAPAQCRVAHLTDDVAVDYDAQDEVVGVEVLHARRVLGGGGTPAVELKNVMGRPAAG